MLVLSELAEHWDVPTNRLYRIRDEFVRRHVKITDLVAGNVNTQGILFPQRILEKAMAAGLRAAEVYRPDPFGQLAARKAISLYYAREGLRIPPENFVLTPGTSISYWYTFKLLANPGDEILCPAPSYPLFDSIAALSGVKLIPYRLEQRARWEINFDHLESGVTPRTKAIILISPHNPTGAVATEDEVQRLGEIAGRRGLAIISDEVFSPFLHDRNDLPRPAETSAPLVITLNGLSKMLALPGMKIGWMAVTGDPALVKKALKTLEMISDTFLPVNEAAQFALPEILKTGSAFQKSYVAAIQKRMASAIKVLEGRPGISFVKPEGGFFLTLKLNGSGADEEEIACRLLQKHQILVHPGYFYDMEGRHLVLSLVSRPAALRKSLHDLIGLIR
jgi:aspartate/methionine/tyrosine aminotransferase